jgi:hypothetical protein
VQKVGRVSTDLTLYLKEEVAMNYLSLLINAFAPQRTATAETDGDTLMVINSLAASQLSHEDLAASDDYLDEMLDGTEWHMSLMDLASLDNAASLLPRSA